MNHTPTTYTSDEFRIQSLNCHKCYNVLSSLLNTTNPLDYDILCIQEPPPNINISLFPALDTPHPHL